MGAGSGSGRWAPPSFVRAFLRRLVGSVGSRCLFEGSATLGLFVCMFVCLFVCLCQCESELDGARRAERCIPPSLPPSLQSLSRALTRARRCAREMASEGERRAAGLEHESQVPQDFGVRGVLTVSHTPLRGCAARPSPGY